MKNWGDDLKSIELVRQFNSNIKKIFKKKEVDVTRKPNRKKGFLYVYF